MERLMNRFSPAALRRSGLTAWLFLAVCASTTHAAPPCSDCGVVAASQPRAAAAGAQMLARGGNAIDAAAAVQFALNVVEPQSSGLGGGGFMLVYLAKTGQTWLVDSRERAPRAATPDMFNPGGSALSFDTASTSGLAVGVPGTLAGVDHALKRWGTLRLADTLQPAIALAERGFRVNRFLAEDLAADNGHTRRQPETAALFHPHGATLKEGDLLRQPDLAKTFRLIARQGAAVFYRGAVARAIIAAQQRSATTPAAIGRGRMTLADLARYRVAIRTPVETDYRGWRIVGMPPPSSGGLTMLEILKLLEPWPLGDAQQGYGIGSAATLHVMIEAMRVAFADRAVWIGDDDFVHVPTRGLLMPAYLATRERLIHADTRMTTPVAGSPLPYAAARDARRSDPEKGLHTTHFSIIDRWGNIVSYTSTIENTWGSGILVPGYGFMLNNELTDFNFVPSVDAASGNPGANDVAPGKRPRSSMAPTLIFNNGKPYAAFGSPGGSTIINSVLNVTLNLIDHRMTLQQAIAAPRLSVTSADGAVSCEGGAPFMQPKITLSTQDALRRLGHVSLGEPGSDACTASMGSVQGVAVDPRTGAHDGAADPRREGTVIVVKHH
jgi:gamma-glutamyltranspeptidase/glutathione hydrolase